MADDLTTTIQTNAAGPKRARGDSSEMEQHPLPDQIAADRYLKSKAASQASGCLGLRVQKLVPPGSV